MYPCWVLHTWQQLSILEGYTILDSKCLSLWGTLYMTASVYPCGVHYTWQQAYPCGVHYTWQQAYPCGVHYTWQQAYPCRVCFTYDKCIHNSVSNLLGYTICDSECLPLWSTLYMTVSVYPCGVHYTWQ